MDEKKTENFHWNFLLKVESVRLKPKKKAAVSIMENYEFQSGEESLLQAFLASLVYQDSNTGMEEMIVLQRNITQKKLFHCDLGGKNIKNKARRYEET